MPVSAEGSRGPVNFHCLQRVKVYRLNDEGKWDDRGTGHVSVEYLEQSDVVGLVVIDERSNGTLLVHHISSDDIYRRQEDTIIAWRDAEIATDLALSFQEAMGCSFIWDQLCSVQRSIQFPSVNAIDVGPQVVDEMERCGTSQGNDDIFHEGKSSATIELPQPELSTLPLILKLLEGHIENPIQVADLIVQDQVFFHKLLNLFNICEEVMDIEGLCLIFKIMKAIILLNNSQIFEMIFSNEYIMDVVGALEYDPELPCRQEHRSFLNDQVIFKEAMPITNSLVLSKIHQTYRIGYIKDVILPRVLDESTISTINSIMHANNAAVISFLKDDSAFIREMFKRLKAPDRSDQEKEDLIRFLQEFCSLSKNLPLVHQMRLFRNFANEGLFEVIIDALQSHDVSLRLSGTDILIAVINQDPNLPCQFVLQQEGHTLLALLVKGISTDLGGEQDAQFLEIIRMLLDPYSIAPHQFHKDGIVEIFYDKYVDQLIDVITSACPANGFTELGGESTCFVGGATPCDRTPEFLSNICDLLCFCVLHHTHKIKHYFLHNNVIGKVLYLTHRNEKFLVASAVRFLRAVISHSDDFLHCHIVKNDLFEPVISAFVANGNRYNLLNSTVLELMEYIRKEKFMSLIAYLVENYSHQLEKIDYVDTFHQLKQIYVQSLEGQRPSDVSGGIKDHGGPPDQSNQTNAVSETRKHNDDDRSLEREEGYFNEDSDGKEDSKSARIVIASSQHAHAVIGNGNVLDSSPARVGAVRLIDYADGENDSPMQMNGSQGPKYVNSEKTISSLPINDSLVHEMGHSPNSKRRISTGDANDSERDSPQKRRLHINAKDHVASVAAVNKVKQNQDYVGCNHDTGSQDHMVVDIYVGVERSTKEGDSLVSTDPNGHESGIMEGRYGNGNDGSPSISKQDSECERPGIGVEENSKQDKQNEDGPSSACIEPVVKGGAQSPGPSSVQ